MVSRRPAMGAHLADSRTRAADARPIVPLLIGATLALTLLVDVSVALQVRLSTYTANGGGAHSNNAPPVLVLLSLAVPLVGALALVWGPDYVRRHAGSMTIDPLRPLTQEEAEATTRTTAPSLTLAFWWWRPRTWRARSYTVSLALALLTSIVANVLAATPSARPAAQWWWIGSIVLVLVAAATSGVASWPLGFWRPRAWISLARLRAVSVDAALLLVLVIGSLVLRLVDLTGLPYVIHGDEAACALEALRWLHGDVSTLISTGWSGLPVLGYAPPALLMSVVGVSVWTFRLSSVLIGTATVVLLYALAREVATRRLAFMAAALLAVAHIDIEFSRTGFHYIYGPFVVELTLWLLVRALRRESVIAAALAGVGLSLAVQVYFSARIVYAIVPIYLVADYLANRNRFARRVHLVGWLVLSFVVAVAPLGVYFLQNPAPLGDRAAGVLILHLTPDMRNHLLSQFGTANLAIVIWRQVAAAPLLFGTLTDQTLQYGARYALFDPLVAALILLGFIYALLRLRQPIYLLLVSWVLLTIAVGVLLTVDMPSWPRLLVMVPALCLLAAVAAEALLRWLEEVALAVAQSLHSADGLRGWRLAVPIALLAGGLIVYSGAVSAHHYFVDYPASLNADANRTLPTDIARYLAQVPSGTQIVLFGSDTIFDYPTLQFLAPQVQGQQITDSRQFVAALHRRGSAAMLVLVTPSAMREFDSLRAIPGDIPPGRYTLRPNMWGHVTFATYSIGVPDIPEARVLP